MQRHTDYMEFKAPMLHTTSAGQTDGSRLVGQCSNWEAVIRVRIKLRLFQACLA